MRREKEEEEEEGGGHAPEPAEDWQPLPFPDTRTHPTGVEVTARVRGIHLVQALTLTLTLTLT